MQLDRPVTPARKIAGNILIVLPSLALTFSSVMKFAHVPKVVEQLEKAGFTDGKVNLVAALELLSAAVFLWPRSRSIGILVFSAFLGGAICSHVQSGETAKAAPAVILLLLAWTGAWLRHPQMRWSFNQKEIA